MARLLPKTLAKVLTTIACHAPGEHGIYWDRDGTMPWKEFYWTLQEDPSLRYVKDSNVKELVLLGIDLPFVLEDGLLKLKDANQMPDYRVVAPPVRLFFGLRPRQYRAVAQDGLAVPATRNYLALAADAELAMRIGRRRDPAPVQIEIHAERAADEAGVVFYDAGGSLFLVDLPIPADFVVLPKVPEERIAPPPAKPKKRPVEPRPDQAAAGGSLILGSRGFRELFEAEHAEEMESSKRSGKARREKDWKKERRKERHKREL